MSVHVNDGENVGTAMILLFSLIILGMLFIRLCGMYPWICGCESVYPDIDLSFCAKTIRSSLNN